MSLFRYVVMMLLPGDPFVRAAMATDQKPAILMHAVNESLSALGEPIKKTVVWHLNLNGIFIESEQFDIATFYKTLEDIMGNGSEVVLDTIYGILARRKDFPLSKDRSRSMLDRIQDSMKAEGGAGVE